MTSGLGRASAFLKAVRHSQPFNGVATTTCRALLRPFGRVPDSLVRHLPRRGRVSCRLPNGRQLILDTEADDWISNQVFWRGWDAYEPEATPIFYRMAREAAVVLDVGAHIGFHSLLASLANPSARVFALEPHPALFARLRQNIAANQLTNVFPVPAAAADSRGTGTLFVPGPGLPSSSTLANEFNVCPADRRTMPVELTTIDALAEEHALDGVDLVKIDTETTEPSVLRGMTECLRR
ncbi:MAG TPA: FkbM family methyltransferase, partial [Vicinamibacteria bacterium]